MAERANPTSATGQASTAGQGRAKGCGALTRRRLLSGAAAAVGLYAGSRFGFRLWMEEALPGDAPRIAFSISDAWLNRLGVTDTTYQQAMTRSGGALVRTEPADPRTADRLLDETSCAGLLLTGGGDVDPQTYGGRSEDGLLVDARRDAFEIALVRGALDRRLPILGICRGCQLLNVALGGSLVTLRDHPTLGPAHFGLEGHAIRLAAGSHLAESHGTRDLARVKSFHGQAIDRTGPDVHITARGPGEVPEGIELDTPEQWAVGVQWHPELDPLDPVQNRLFEAFVERAAALTTRQLAR